MKKSKLIKKVRKLKRMNNTQMQMIIDERQVRDNQREVIYTMRNQIARANNHKDQFDRVTEKNKELEKLLRAERKASKSLDRVVTGNAKHINEIATTNDLNLKGLRKTCLQRDELKIKNTKLEDDLARSDSDHYRTKVKHDKLIAENASLELARANLSDVRDATIGAIEVLASTLHPDLNLNPTDIFNAERQIYLPDPNERKYNELSEHERVLVTLYKILE